MTIYDVAHRAGVSISTVSLALNSGTRVSPQTLAKVLAAADELGFEPKERAVARARQGVGRIGVMAPFSSYPSFARRLNGVLEELRDQALEVVVFDHTSAAETTSPLLAGLPIIRRLDGLIIMALPLDDAVAQRLRVRLPTVLLESSRPDFDCISTDDEAGGGQVARHLLEHGHRRFAYLGETQRSHAYRSPSEQRLAGFRRAVLAGGGELVATMTVHHDIESAAAATRALLAGQRPPTAVFAHDDLLAAGVLRAAREVGTAVPGALAVVGFDDTDLAAALGLTTVRQQFEESGRLAARMLTERRQRPTAAQRRVVLGLDLVERESTAVPATGSPVPDQPEPVRDRPASGRRAPGDTASTDRPAPKRGRSAQPARK